MTTIDPSQSTLSPNFAQYVYNMLGKGERAANLQYQPFTGQRFAGPSALQQQAFTGLGGLQTPSQFGTATQLATQAGQAAPAFQAGQFSTGLGPVGSVQDYMSPYTQGVINQQTQEAIRQADIARGSRQARFAQAGAFGGSRQAIEEAEANRNLQQQLGGITATGMQSAYDRALQQRQQEAQLGLQAQQYGEQSRQYGAGLGLQGLGQQLQAAQTLGQLGQQQFGAGLQGLQAQLGAGETQRGIAQQPLDFGYQQFRESTQYPMQQASFMHSLLGYMPLTANAYNPGSSMAGGMLQGGAMGAGIYDLLKK